jgi:hypothetical protein
VPVWSQIEVDIGILTACLPCLSPLLRLFFHSTHQQRTMTPSMVTLPKYAGSRSWGSMDSQESADAKEKEAADAHADERRETDRDQARLGDGAKEAQWSEKELPPIPEESERGSAYYEDASDEEEAREIGVARQVGIARSSSRRVEFSRRIS